MQPVRYTKIIPQEGQPLTEVFRKAHALGFELVQFDGWTDSDIGTSSNPGPSRAMVKENAKYVAEILDACRIQFNDNTEDWPEIRTVRVEG
jgi:hypothetical protein